MKGIFGTEVLHYKILLSPATKLGQSNIFRSVCQEFCPQGGHAWRGVGGVQGRRVMCGRGACIAGGMCGRGLWQGACMVGGCAWWGACMAGGVCMAGGHAWQEGRAWQGGMHGTYYENCRQVDAHAYNKCFPWFIHCRNK